MVKGLPKSIIKKYGISKKAWEIYRGLKKRKPFKRQTLIQPGGTKTMAKRKRGYFGKPKRKYRKQRQIPLLPTLGFAQNFVRTAPSRSTLLKDIQTGNWQLLAYDAREIFLGIDNQGKLQWNWLMQTWLPVVAGYVASKLATRLGLNRAMSQIPLVGKYVKL